MRLFIVPGSPYARIVRMALIEKGLEVAPEVAVLRDTDATLLDITPAGRVPTLITDDGTVLTETTPILLHLDAIEPQPPLLRLDGDDAWRGVAAYARAIGLIDGVAVWNRELRRPVQERSPAVIALEAARATRVADALDADVANGCYAGGAAGWPDAAWIALAAGLGYCARRHPAFDWATGRPALSAWLAAAAARVSFHETLPPFA